MSESTHTGVAANAATNGTNGNHASAPVIERPARTTPPPEPPAKSKFSLKRPLMILLVLGAGVAYVAVRGVEKAKEDVIRVAKVAYHQVAGGEKKEIVNPLPLQPPTTAWDGLVDVSKTERETIGMRVTAVLAQTEPLKLELNGATDYDQNTMTKIRPLFDARVTAVYKSTGQAVKKGEPLIELYSTALAAAKSDLRAKFVQWDHDRKLLDSRRPLALSKEISNVIWVDTQNAELNSHNGYLTALDKLIVYGISQDEIQKLIGQLSDKTSETGEVEDVHDISKMTLRAPIDGIIVERDVVSGNFYDDMAVLMVISPMDKLWVWGNVFEKDQSQVYLGQTWEVEFPYLDEKIEGQVEHISTRVDPVTRTLKIRATIPNPGKKFKAEMLVKAVLRIPPVPGHTVIPRNAMAVINREHCVFVQRPDNPDKFERRIIDVDQERYDQVVVKSGLKPGEKIVTNGSLILSQLYEDQSTLNSGLPL